MCCLLFEKEVKWERISQSWLKGRPPHSILTVNKFLWGLCSPWEEEEEQENDLSGCSVTWGLGGRWTGARLNPFELSLILEGHLSHSLQWVWLPLPTSWGSPHLSMAQDPISAPAPVTPQQRQSLSPHNPAWPWGPWAGLIHSLITWLVASPSLGMCLMPRTEFGPSALHCPAVVWGGGTDTGCQAQLRWPGGAPTAPGPQGPTGSTWPEPSFWHWWISHHECRWVGKSSWPEHRPETSTAMNSSTNPLILLSKVNQACQVWLTHGKSMLTAPSHFPLSDLLKSGFQEDLTHDFSKDWSEADKPIVPWITCFLFQGPQRGNLDHSFFEDQYKICFCLVTRISPDLCDLSKTTEIGLTMTLASFFNTLRRRLVWIKFSQLTPDSACTHCWYFLSSSNPVCRDLEGLDGRDWDRGGNIFIYRLFLSVSFLFFFFF